MAYRDRVYLRTRVAEAAYRLGSVELNVSEDCWEAVRVYDGAWRIRSWRCDSKPLKEPTPRGKGELKEAVLFTGRVEGAKIQLDPLELEAVIEEAGRSAKCPTEIVASLVCFEKRINHADGAAEYTHCYIDVIISIAYGRLSVSDRIATTDAQSLRLLPHIVERMCEKATLASKSLKSISPMDAGRWSVILAGSAAGSLIHEIGHALEGDWGARLPTGAQIAPESFSLRDEPYNTLAPYNHPFDDEAVVAASRTLVHMGVVKEHLGTRWSASGKPGSARGLFHPPKALHAVLVLSTGDWREQEIIEETRRGVLVETVHSAFLDNNVVTIIPELAWLVDHGEIVSAIRLNRIRLRLGKELMTIDALGRQLWTRFTTEKGHPQVELAPTIRLQAYVD
ncbi:hypothetical protein Pyrfu_0278 [Pyrolobus fumarii 1A]|uniref:Metalloprotease TldD/E C-terminal domain-containing protein n=1 Tax=Pyrolobus fumarii (strain DSM 11204 / 1A) TaxID=694429 RepID=G0EFA7_PYRF1|nr:metallopeptidase TldD-related protein [Pyrolobus fumarii]AEM38150.1 hypothetical protein Pyrfu_0278 [Pyrolobus fumarii 1A]